MRVCVSVCECVWACVCVCTMMCSWSKVHGEAVVNVAMEKNTNYLKTLCISINIFCISEMELCPRIFEACYDRFGSGIFR